MLKNFLLTSVFVLLLAIYPSSCFASQCDLPEECRFLYNQAILDAGTSESSELEELSPIVADKIKVATWTDYSGYELGPNTLGVDVWITIIPQMQKKCQTFLKNLSLKELNLRLEQLMGLPPNDGKTKVVEMVVQTSDIFRPCPDPDITKTVCNQSLSPNVNPRYLYWFAQNVLSSYKIPGGYPWTRLGYTYDWYPDSPEMGLPEYVIRKGSVVQVTSIKSTSEYCSP